MRKLHFKVYRQLLTIGRVDVVLFQLGGHVRTKGTAREGVTMVKATVMSDATTANPGEHKSKETSVTPGQTEVSLRLWAREGLKSGIWDVTRGEF